jgi:signal transduction histidine kinase
MAFGQTSFRRILLSRLLLVSVPVLLIGVYVTYRKARSAFLETARQNLTESAVRRGDSIRQSIEALQTNLMAASNSVVLKLGSQQDKQSFLAQLAKQLPTKIECIQLIDLTLREGTISTCGDRVLGSINTPQWSQRQNHLLTNLDSISVKILLPEKAPKNNRHQLKVLLAAPVYDRANTLHYALSLQAALLEQEKDKFEPGSLEGSPVVIDQRGTILAHPLPTRVGHNISQEADAERLKSLLGNAIAGREDFLHLFAFEKDGVELVAGYSSIPSPVTGEGQQKWAILSVASLEAALSPLEEIQRVLAYLVLALLSVSILAVLYISWELARPLEQIRDYALNQDNPNSEEQIPQNIKIREFQELAIAIEAMLHRLQTWGEEIFSSWQEAQTANRLKSEFLATTSHELRTPLNGIINCVRVVRDGYCDSQEEEQEFLQQADEAALHLLGIINDILDIARIEAGELSVTLEPVQLSKILKEVINLQSVCVQQKKLTLTLQECQENLKVNADAAKLKQVLLNIVGNAVKFTESGGITISTHIETSQTSTLEAPTVIIKVQDTGIGIAPNQQDKLFRPFVMVDGTTTRKFGGTGLGLAISRNLMELMGGTISLFSAGLHQGTMVVIRLSLAETSLLPRLRHEVETEKRRHGDTEIKV